MEPQEILSPSLSEAKLKRLEYLKQGYSASNIRFEIYRDVYYFTVIPKRP